MDITMWYVVTASMMYLLSYPMGTWISKYLDEDVYAQV